MIADLRPVVLTRRELNQMKTAIRELHTRIKDLEDSRVLHGDEYRQKLNAQGRARKRKARDTNGSRRY